MNSSPISYKRHRFPPQISALAVWLYAHFNLSLREVEELLLQRGIDVSYETVRRWVIKFRAQITRKFRQRQDRPGDIWHLDEVIVRVSGRKFGLGAQSINMVSFWMKYFNRNVTNDPPNGC